MRVFLLPIAMLVVLIATWGTRVDKSALVSQQAEGAECGAGFNPAPHPLNISSVPQNQSDEALTQTGIATQATIKANEYAVYSAVLNGMYLNNRFKDRSPTPGDLPVVLFNGRYVDDSVKLLVIHHETTRCLPLPGGAEQAERIQEMEEDVVKDMPALNGDTLADFQAKKKACHPLSKRFNTPVKFVLVSEKDLKPVFPERVFDRSWSLFYKKYPGSSGVINFSNVGFNRAMTQAFVYTGRSCGGLCGEGYYVLLSKKDKVWSITTKLMVWVS